MIISRFPHATNVIFNLYEEENLMDKKIIFTSDIFRMNLDKTPYFDSGLLTIYETFVEQIELATGIRPEYNLAEDKKIFDRDEFFRLCNLEVSPNSWVAISTGQISQEAEEYLAKTFKDYFIIFYHGNPKVLDILNKYQITYINIQNSSHKFLEDLHFHMNTNINGIFEKLLKYKLPESAIYMNAARVKSCYGNQLINKNGYKKNSLLICGQTDNDISLVNNNHFVCFEDYKEEILGIISKYEHVYYKKHPYAKKDDKNQKFIKTIPNIEYINENFYALMANPAITGVCALSSGVLEEAEYFRKNIHVLSHKFFEYNKDTNNPDIKKFTVLKDDYFSPTFWADILSPCFNTREVEYFNFNAKESFIRKNVIHNWWGYNISRDRELLSKVNKLNNILDKKKRSLKYILGRGVSLFIPSKKLRRKLRGDL